MSAVSKYEKKSNKVLHINNNVPFDIAYHKKLSDNEWENHRNSIDYNIENITNEKAILNKRKENDEKENRQKRIKYEEIRERNQVPLEKLSQEKFKYRLDTFSAFLKNLGLFLAWLFKYIYEMLGAFIKTLLSGVKTIVKSDVIIGAILFVIFILIILTYVFGVILPISNKNVPVNSTTDHNLAEEKLEYNKDKPFIANMYDTISNIGGGLTYLKKMIFNLNGRFNALDENNNYLNMKDRQEYKGGRWDNINNMELSKLSQNFKNISNDNMIYSIKKPKDFKFNITTYDNNNDIEKLPQALKDKINTSNENLFLHWKETTTNENMVKYILQCNPYNKDKKELKLFNDNGDKCEIYKKSYSKYNNNVDKLNYYILQEKRYDFSNGLDDYII